jgi:hypothetical protein
MAKKSEIKAVSSFHLGDRVRIKGLAGQIGRITELRGPLGPGGTLVYRVRVGRKPSVSYIELLGDQVEYLPMTGPAEQVKRRNGSAKALKAKTDG